MSRTRGRNPVSSSGGAAAPAFELIPLGELLAEHDDDEIVALAGGLAVPLGALRLLWRLEDHGFAITVSDAGLHVSPRSQVTPADDAAIRQFRNELIQLVEYCEAIQ
jgi:hypothetical protein